MAIDNEMLMNIINKSKDNNGALMQILHDVQDSFGYIPYEAQKVIAQELNVPLSEVYGVITFYSRFTLNPVGKYKVGVCLGTACYVKGSDKVLERIESILKIKAGDLLNINSFSAE